MKKFINGDTPYSFFVTHTTLAFIVIVSAQLCLFISEMETKHIPTFVYSAVTTLIPLSVIVLGVTIGKFMESTKYKKEVRILCIPWLIFWIYFLYFNFFGEYNYNPFHILFERSVLWFIN